MDQTLRRMIGERDESAIEDAYFNGSCSHFFVVDWREDDADIVECCARCLGKSSLHAEWQDASLMIIFDGKETVVPLQGNEGDRHVTISSLNDMLQPDCEIRFLVCSHGGDSAGFAALSAADWESLEHEFPEASQENFVKLRELPNIFTEMTDDHLPAAAQARHQRMLDRNA